MRMTAQIVCLLTALVFVAIGSSVPEAPLTEFVEAKPADTQPLYEQCQAEFGEFGPYPSTMPHLAPSP